jgi:hypothetical protein
MPEYAVYLFFRKEGWYSIECPDGDAQAIQQAEMNPGTILVQDIDERIVWQSPDAALKDAKP